MNIRTDDVLRAVKRNARRLRLRYGDAWTEEARKAALEARRRKALYRAKEIARTRCKKATSTILRQHRRFTPVEVKFLRNGISSMKERKKNSLNRTFDAWVKGDGKGIYKSERFEKETDAKKYYASTVNIAKFSECSMARREVMASLLNDYLGLDLVPVTTFKRGLKTGDGSIQKWVDGLGTSRLKVVEILTHAEYEDSKVRNRIYDAAIYDDLIGNIDRHSNNADLDAEGNLILFDNGASFTHNPEVAWNGSMRTCFLENVMAFESSSARKAVARDFKKNYLKRSKPLIEKLTSKEGVAAVNTMFRTYRLPEKEQVAFWDRVRKIEGGEFPWESEGLFK